MRYVPRNPGSVDAFQLGDAPESLPSYLGIKRAREVLAPGQYDPQYADYYVLGGQLVAPGSYAIWNDGRTQIAQVMSRRNFEAIYRPMIQVSPDDVIDLDEVVNTQEESMDNPEEILQ